MSRLPASIACTSGRAAQATKKNASSNSPIDDGARSTLRYEPVITTASSAIARDRQRDDARQSVQFAHAGDAGEFGQQRAQRGDAEAGDGQPGPERAERRADQLAVAAAGEDAEPDGQFLHDVEDRYQQELQASSR